MGATTKQFEDCIRDFTGAKHVIAVNTGTSALHIVLASLDLQPGDEVIVPSLTFVPRCRRSWPSAPNRSSVKSSPTHSIWI